MKTILVAIAAVLSAAAAHAQTTYFGSDGSYQGQSQYNNITGSTTYFGSDGSYQGQSQYNGITGGTTYFGSDGGYRGQSLPTFPRPGCIGMNC